MTCKSDSTTLPIVIEKLVCMFRGIVEHCIVVICQWVHLRWLTGSKQFMLGINEAFSLGKSLLTTWDLAREKSPSEIASQAANHVEQAQSFIMFSFWPPPSSSPIVPQAVVPWSTTRPPSTCAYLLARSSLAPSPWACLSSTPQWHCSVWSSLTSPSNTGGTRLELHALHTFIIFLISLCVSKHICNSALISFCCAVTGKPFSSIPAISQLFEFLCRLLFCLYLQDCWDSKWVLCPLPGFRCSITLLSASNRPRGFASRPYSSIYLQQS